MKFLSLILIALFCFHVRAEEVYPSEMPSRLLGLDQQNVGSCMAESQANAIEHFFSERKMRLRISPHYSHAKYWSDDEKAPAQILTAEDRAYLNAGPSIVPDFMWPEDGRGFASDRTRIRISPLSVYNPDSAYPKSSDAFGFKEKYWTFHTAKNGSYSNTASIGDLKKMVKEKRAIALSLNSDILYMMNPYTGLLNDKYTLAKLKESIDLRADYCGDQAPKHFGETICHSVAIVGYDDSLYSEHGYESGSGAFIIANSWTDPEVIQLAMREPNHGELIELQKMRLKVYNQNLPSYYAIPYQYIIDLINHDSNDPKSSKGVGGFNAFSINADQFYAYYTQLAQKYEVHTIPYICDRSKIDFLKYLTGDLFMRIATEPKYAKPELMDLIHINLDVTEINHINRIFNYAKLSVNKDTGVNRLNDFFNGSYGNYYCPYSPSSFFPNTADMQQPELKKLIDETSIDPSFSYLFNLFQWFNTANIGV